MPTLSTGTGLDLWKHYQNVIENMIAIIRISHARFSRDTLFQLSNKYVLICQLVTDTLNRSQVPRYTVDLRYAPDGGWPSATEQQLSDDTEAWLGEDALFVPGGATAGVENEDTADADADGPAISHATRRSNKTKRDRRKRTISAAERAKGASVRTRDRSLCTPQSECSNNIKPRPRRFSQDEGARRGRRLGNELYTHTHV